MNNNSGLCYLHIQYDVKCIQKGNAEFTLAILDLVKINITNFIFPVRRCLERACL